MFIYIWAGPHHLHYTALPIWASTLGMVFSVMLWMPSWGGMINGLLTLRGAWHKVATDPVLKFFVVGVTFYGMSTFEGPMLSIKSRQRAVATTPTGRSPTSTAGRSGWNGFMTFGMMYWLLPAALPDQALQREAGVAAGTSGSGTIGILLYIMSMYAAGLTQGLMWRAFDDAGQLAYPDFIETTGDHPHVLGPRIGGALYLSPACSVRSTSS